MKKMLMIVKLCLIGMLSTYATAANWDNGALGSDSWTDAANWQGDVLPAGANTWMDNSDTAVINVGDTGNVGMFFPQGSGGGTADLTIQGTLNTTGRIRIADAINSNGIITIDGGTLNVPDHMYVGSAYLAGNISASGTLVVKNGGVVNQTANGYGLKVPAHYADSNTSGLIELFDGIIHTVDLYIGATGLVKVGAGSIIIEGNEFTEMNNYKNAGLLVPMNPLDTIDVSYDGDFTTITSVPEPATMALLGLGGLFIKKRKKC